MTNKNHCCFWQQTAVRLHCKFVKHLNTKFTKAVRCQTLTHFILTDLVDRPRMGSRDDGRTAAHVEVENLQGPVPPSSEHEVWGLVRELLSAEGGMDR